MIEDSFKSTRNIYRLILTVSFITLIFSLSINIPENKQEQLRLVNKIIDFDFLEYDSFVESKIKNEIEKNFTKLSKELETKLEEEDFTIFNIHHISDSFSKSPHIGKILTKDLVLSNVSNASLNSLDELNGLSLNKDVQVVTFEIEEISKKIISFLRNNKKIGLRVDNVNLGIGDFQFTGETFISSDTTLLSLYFELPEKIRSTGSPVFNIDFPAKIISIPNTSFNSWLIDDPNRKSIVELKEGKLEWLPSLKILPNGFREEKLGLLSKNLEKKITESAPEEQSVSIFGASIPGILFVYASPILLFALMYYLFNLTTHLVKLSRDYENIKYFKEFSWMPLSISNYWKAELIGSIVIIPFASLSILLIKLNQFESSNTLFKIILLFTFIGCSFFARIVLNNIKSIRLLMN